MIKLDEIDSAAAFPVCPGRAKVIVASGLNAKEQFKELLNRKV